MGLLSCFSFNYPQVEFLYPTPRSNFCTLPLGRISVPYPSAKFLYPTPRQDFSFFDKKILGFLTASVGTGQIDILKSPDQYFFCSEYVEHPYRTPKTCLNFFCQKETQKNDYENPSGLSPILCGLPPSLPLYLQPSCTSLGDLAQLLSANQRINQCITCLLALLSTLPAFSANGLCNFSVLSVIQETLKISKTIRGEGQRCAGKWERRRDCGGNFGIPQDNPTGGLGPIF